MIQVPQIPFLPSLTSLFPQFPEEEEKKISIIYKTKFESVNAWLYSTSILDDSQILLNDLP
jgi:hypothetical protein